MNKISLLFKIFIRLKYFTLGLFGFVSISTQSGGVVLRIMCIFVEDFFFFIVTLVNRRTLNDFTSNKQNVLDLRTFCCEEKN